MEQQAAAVVDPNLSSVGEAVEERGRRWRCADAGAHEHLGHRRAGSRPAAPQGQKRGSGGPGHGRGRHGDGEEAAAGGSKTLAAGWGL